MNDRDTVTIIMTQRERFSLVCESIRSLYESTQHPFKLIYVDGNSPETISKPVDKLRQEYDFTVIRKDYFLPPNMARNMAIEAIDGESRYVAFVDNDVMFEPGWLETLVDTAKETEAAMVTPLVMIGNPERMETVRIHFAGGEIEIKETPEGRRFGDTHRHGDQKLSAVQGSLKQGLSDSVEFHAVLVRRDMLDKALPLDEELRATSEHLDLSLTMTELGGRIIFEPRSKVTYVVGKPLEPFEALFFILRWSDLWAKHSEKRFQNKWGFLEDERVMKNFVVDHRLHAFGHGAKRLERILGYRWSRKVLAWLYEKRLNDAKKYAFPGTLS